jgi:hypothetical protein
MLISLLSAKGSPGVTTLSLGLAARWPRPGAVVVEVDPAGGDLAARFGHPPAVPGQEPGLSAMAATRSGSRSRPDPAAWVQATAPGVDVVATEPGTTVTAASLQELSERGPALLEELARGRPAVLLDAGRWDTGSLANPLIAAANMTIMVLRPSLDQFRQVEARLPALRTQARHLRLVVVGDHPWAPADIAAGLGVKLAGAVPVDRQGAGLLSGELAPHRGWRSKSWTRLPLLRACSSIATDMVRQAPVPIGGIPAVVVRGEPQVWPPVPPRLDQVPQS